MGRKSCQFSALCFAFRHAHPFFCCSVSCLGSCLVGVFNGFKKPPSSSFCLSLFLFFYGIYGTFLDGVLLLETCEVVMREIAMS